MRRTGGGLALTLVLAAVGPHASHSDDLIAARLPRITYRGGPFLRQPRIVMVSFAGDDTSERRRVERRRQWRVEDDVSAAAIRAGQLAPIDAESLIVVYLPAGTVLRDASTPRYCGDGPRGFHRTLRMPSGDLPWAVVPRCGGLDDLTATASHEILEAVTNPDPSRRGFAFVPDAASRGFTAAGVEPVDPCGLITRNGHRTTADGFVVQRSWSNRAAANGGDPCVPASAADSYRALVPDQSVVRLRSVGARATVALTAIAVAPDAAPWTLSAVDLTADEDGAFIDTTLDRTQVRAGDTVALRLTARRPSRRQSTVVGVVSRVGDREHLWPIAVSLR